METEGKGRVFLVGAGPGDPELLTLRAASLLRKADLVLHDDLVPPAVLAVAGPHALVVSVGKRCGAKRVHQQEIHALMIEGARRNLCVVRLKSGDPLVFGRAAEEMDALRVAGIQCEVVPGITAAFAAAAQIGCSLTDRRTSSSVEFHTGHSAADGTADSDAHSPTRVVYMPGRSFAELAAERLAAGDSPQLPCCIISRAAQPDQQIVWSTLELLAQVEPGPAPVLLLTGWALASAASAAAEVGNASGHPLSASLPMGNGVEAERSRRDA